MERVAAWSARPVFITSTFQDMQAERDVLRNFVFPALEERLRARRQHLEWIDLRVGVATAGEAEEAKRELQVLKVCLEEVRVHPDAARGMRRARPSGAERGHGHCSRL